MNAILEQTSFAPVTIGKNQIEAHLVYLFRLMTDEQKSALLAFCDATLSGQMSGEWELLDREPDGITVSKGDLTSLINHVEFLSAWWKKYGSGISSINRKCAAAIHDNFVDGVCVARSLRRQGNLTSISDYVKHYPWEGDYSEKIRYSEAYPV